MDSKHTPGPWRLEFDEGGGYDCMTDAYSVSAGSALICSLDCRDYGQESCSSLPPGAMAKAQANARLVAAAPDLLEALEKILAESDERAAEDADSEGHSRRPDTGGEFLARAAIAKAKGEA